MSTEYASKASIFRNSSNKEESKIGAFNIIYAILQQQQTSKSHLIAHRRQSVCCCFIFAFESLFGF